MNRIKDYYNLADKWLKINDYGQRLIAMHFKIIDFGTEWSMTDETRKKIFIDLIDLKKYTEFKSLVDNYLRMQYKDDYH